MTEERFEGLEGRECGEHRTLGGRAWCFDCSTYCYPNPEMACPGCELPYLRRIVDGTIALRAAQRAYMDHRGDDAFGRKVGEAAEAVDKLLLSYMQGES